MKLYYASGACSLAALIAAEEAGLQLDLARVDIRVSPHVLENGADFRTINAKGYIPALQLDGGEVLTEGVAILQYLDDRRAEAGARYDCMEKYRLQEWLTFVATELHKSFSPWLFHPEYGEQAAAVARGRISDRFDLLERHFGKSECLLGPKFSVADAYCFSIARWAPGRGIDLAPWPALSAYLKRIASRSKVVEALRRHW